MKLSFAAAATLMTLVSAQSISEIPQCAQQCILDAVKSATKCSQTDYKCICDNENALVGAATPCVISSCGADVATSQVLPATQKFCAEAEAGGSSSSLSVSVSTSSSSGSSASSIATSTSTSTVVETSSSSSGELSLPPATSTAVTTTAITTSASVTTSVSTRGNFSTTASPTSVSTAGAAIAGSVGSLAMLLLGAIAVL